MKDITIEDFHKLIREMEEQDRQRSLQPMYVSKEFLEDWDKAIKEQWDTYEDYMTRKKLEEEFWKTWTL